MDSQRQGVYVSPRVLQQCLNFLNTGVAHAVTWRSMRNYVPQLVSEVVFPLMQHTAEDAERVTSNGPVCIPERCVNPPDSVLCEKLSYK